MILPNQNKISFIKPYDFKNNKNSKKAENIIFEATKTLKVR